MSVKKLLRDSPTVVEQLQSRFEAWQESAIKQVSTAYAAWADEVVKTLCNTKNWDASGRQLLAPFTRKILVGDENTNTDLIIGTAYHKHYGAVTVEIRVPSPSWMPEPELEKMLDVAKACYSKICEGMAKEGFTCQPLKPEWVATIIASARVAHVHFYTNLPANYQI